MTSKISDLRTENKKIYLNLIELFVKRRDIVKQIVLLKDLKKLDNFYDPLFEKELFTELKPSLGKLSIKELLAVSLLIEDHVGEEHGYPQWSDKFHLREINAKKFDLINPIMLKIIRPEIFKGLKFSKDFKYLETL